MRLHHPLASRISAGIAFVCLALSLSLGDVSRATGAEPPAPLDGREGRNLALDQFRPKPMLNVPEHHLTKARFPVVDVHMHPKIRLHSSPDLLDDYVKLMDRQNIAVSVSLDGGIGEAFVEHTRYLWTKYPDRFVIFANIDWRGQADEKDYANWDCHRPDFARRMAAELALCKERGCSGLKIFSPLQPLSLHRASSAAIRRAKSGRWQSQLA